MANYSREITDKFLNKYKELESLATNETRKYQFLTNKYRKEYEMIRHIRNELAHSSVNMNYPFIVSEDVLNLLDEMLLEVRHKAIDIAKKRTEIVHVGSSLKMKIAIELMSKYGYSYLPILDESGVAIGIVSSDAILYIISNREKLNFSYEDTIEKYMDIFSIENVKQNFYIFVEEDIYLFELKERVEEYQNTKAKLSIILITKNGKNREKLLGILTPWDLILKK